ncbi:MAG: acylphosphatase [Chitinophagaceae bacterium]|nr:acylphosphatase [Chitinophagaceae bacterium]MCB0739716.1 acylphosphatase [Chitinophagaceae bacterium]HQV06216.1 acylphosphatase [Chitinophagaceae bacterium]
MKTISIIVSGRVQGVWFRQSTKEKAQALGLVGEVKNLTNGSVKILATGDEGTLQEFINWCKIGPTLAEVEKLDIEDCELISFDKFKIVS